MAVHREAPRRCKLLSLFSHHAELAEFHSIKCVEHSRRERSEDRQRVARRSNEHNAQAAPAEILLESQTLIHCDEGVVLRLGSVEQRAVIEIRPSSLVHGVDPMPGSSVPKALGKLPSSKTRTND